MKVLHCIPHLHLGGADRVAVDLVRALGGSDGLEPRLCVFRGADAPDDRLSMVEDAVLLNFHGSHRRPDAFLGFSRALRRVVAEWRPDIIHSHLWPACQFATTALSGVRVRHLWHIHDTRPWLYSEEPRQRLRRAWTRALIRRARPRLVAVSAAAAKFTARPLHLKVGRFDVVWNAVDTGAFDTGRFPARLRRARTVPVIGLAAQYRPEKGHDLLLQACAALRERGVAFRLRLAGSGQTLEATRRLCARLGLDDQVEFLGHVGDVAEFLSELDLFVLSSTANEGLPLSVLEAMAMRVPVVATAVAGTPEVVRDGETGYLVPPGNVGALADAIGRALGGGDDRPRVLANAVRQVQKHHTIEVVVRQLHQVYHSIMQKPPFPPLLDEQPGMEREHYDDR